MRFARGPASTRSVCLLLALAGTALVFGSLWLDWARGTEDLEQGISSGWNWMGVRGEILAVLGLLAAVGAAGGWLLPAKDATVFGIVALVLIGVTAAGLASTFVETIGLFDDENLGYSPAIGLLVFAVGLAVIAGAAIGGLAAVRRGTDTNGI